MHVDRVITPELECSCVDKTYEELTNYEAHDTCMYSCLVPRARARARHRRCLCRACAWCGELANSMCTACEQPLCTLAARGSRSGRDCHALYHEPLCVGLAKADVVKKRNAGGKGKEFSKPTVSQIKRYARKKQRELAEDQ